MTDKPRNKSTMTFTLPSDRPAASFAFLPMELKTAIAREVKLEDEAKQAERVERGDRSSRKPDMLTQLSLVSKDWNAVVKPLLWEHVDLGRHSFAALYTFVKATLPAVHSLIRSLAWSHTSIIAASGKSMYSSGDEMGPSTSAKLDKEEKKLINTVEKHGKFKSNKDDSFRRLRAIEYLVSLIVKKCAKLTAFDYSNLNTFERLVENPSFPYWDNLAQSAFLVKGAQLDSIKLSMWFDPQAKDVQSVLKACRNLRMLDLTDISMGSGMSAVETSSASYKAFLRSIFSMPKLVSLGLFVSLPSKNLKIPVTAPLQQLSLRGKTSSDFLSFEPFIVGAAGTLRTLELLAPPEDDMPDLRTYGGKKTATATTPLPNLKRLTFSSFTPSLLARFSSSPLVIVRFETPRSLGRDDFYGGLGSEEEEDEKASNSKNGDPRFTSFLEAHVHTLKRVEVFADEIDIDGGWTSLKPIKRFCEEKGIEFKLEEDEESGRCYVEQYEYENECDWDGNMEDWSDEGESGSDEE